MSDPKIISPLLDGFLLGSPISDHDGVICCPAVKENSDNKYIVKVISIPASQVQLDALLLTGAYQDPADALDYFKEQADGIEKEAQLLKKLSKLEGFLPYESWQVEPMDNNRLGYEFYLVSSYKRSLEKYMRRNSMTHLGAINLGLDICAALAIARRAGYIYVDLKPGNIFLSLDKGYRIGDLGFMELSSLKYASLPGKYRSAFTPPEMQDMLGTVNTTVDTYALGMILYMIYNNGVLPAVDPESDEPLPAPVNADYEISEIILKACAMDPKDRYTDPMEMGQDLVGYMQRNRVNNVPITPPTVTPVVTEASPILDHNGTVYDESAPGEEDAADVAQDSLTEEANSMIQEADALLTADDEISEQVAAPEEAMETSEITEEPDKLPETTEMEEISTASTVESSEEIIPAVEEVMAPTEENNDTDLDEEFAALLAGIDLTEEPEAPPTVKEKPKSTKKKSGKKKKKKKKKKKGGFVTFILLLIFALLIGGGYYYYDNFYLQTINGITATGIRDEMTVTLDTEIDNSLLTIVCTDVYGNNKTSPVENNQATFTELLPDTLYKIRVEIEGFHALHPKGVSTHGYTTTAQTKIASFSAKTGAEDGSVVLNFAVEGPGTNDWICTYSAEDEEEKSVEFSGTMVTINGLTVGKTYTFRLDPVAELFLIGENSTQFTAASIIMAENLTISDYSGDKISVQWNAPADEAVSSWTVRCYSEDGYDNTLTTQDTSASFSGIDTTKAYTIEVLAAGMTHPARVSITANPYTVGSVKIDDSDETKLILSWMHEGEAPVDGWVIKYNIDGSATEGVAQCSGNTAVIQPRIPGASYIFRVESSDGNSVFGNTLSYDCPNAQIYDDEDMRVTSDVINNKLDVNMLVTPDDPNWSYKNTGKKQFTTTFASGQQASLLLHLNSPFYIREKDVTILYVIRNADGDVLPEYISQVTTTWPKMWNGDDYQYCELDIPSIPTQAGTYALFMYFNNAAVASVQFTVTE